jgi:hypothetical protein
MKYPLQLFSSLVFVVLANHGMAACPSNLTAEQMIDCIIAENDCQQERFFRDSAATTDKLAATTTNRVNPELPQVSIIAATAHLGNK